MELEYGDEELFLKVNKLLVIERFSENVISMLCESDSNSRIEDLSDKYTFKSIVSRVWLLVFNLFTEQAQILYEYEALGKVCNKPDVQHTRNCELFVEKLNSHTRTMIKMWHTFKDMDDTLLPDENKELSGI